MLAFDSATLYVEDHGSGFPVLLLHGWPDSHRLWRRQVPDLVRAGFRAIAPDMRGFGQSDRPLTVEAYLPEHTVSDLLRMLDGLGVEQVHVVGHGWGAFAAWMLASSTPERVGRLAILGIAHPSAPQPTDLSHYERIWYQWAFQFDGVAEDLLTANDWRLFREFVDGDPDVEACIEDLSRPGALTASLNWFRANMTPGKSGPAPLARIKAPVLSVWTPGDGDKGLAEERLLASREFVDGEWRHERIEAGHWVPLEHPDLVNRLLIEWFSTSAS
jgi:pimeloyl-ACP methyl ester carboxylesterase